MKPMLVLLFISLVSLARIPGDGALPISLELLESIYGKLALLDSIPEDYQIELRSIAKRYSGDTSILSCSDNYGRINGDSVVVMDNPFAITWLYFSKGNATLIFRLDDGEIWYLQKVKDNLPYNYMLTVTLPPKGDSFTVLYLNYREDK